MRELTELEIEQLDMTGRVPGLKGDNYQLIGLLTESASKQSRDRNAIAGTKRSIGKPRFARTA